MKKTVLLLAAVALAMVVLGGVAWAATIQCPNRQFSNGEPYCEGTDDPDTMHGTPKTDQMYGVAGGDTINGYRGTDSIEGGEGPDTIYAGRGTAPTGGESIEGGEGPDKLYGGPGKDYLFAGRFSALAYQEGASTDYLHGGSEDDRLYGGFQQGGVDRLYGEKGDDGFDVAQRRVFFHNNDPVIEVTKEIVDCGPGIDSVSFDKGVDVVKANCENKAPFKMR